MHLFRFVKGVFSNMQKVLKASPKLETSGSVLGKRKLDFTYPGFISSTTRPPISSPKLTENSGVTKDEAKKK